MSDDPPEDDEAADLPPENTKLNDPQAGRRVRQRISREERERHALWRAILADKTGRREVWRLLTEAHTFNTEFMCGPNGTPQDLATMHNIGRQQWGLKLYHDLLVIDHEGIRLTHAEHDARFAKPRRAVATQGD